MDLQELRRYIVIINGGSGVIYQASDIEHTYILTAKHVIEKAGNIVNQMIRYEYEGGNWIAKSMPSSIHSAKISQLNKSRAFNVNFVWLTHFTKLIPR